MAVVALLSALVHVGVFAVIGLTAPGVRERPPVPEETIELGLFFRPPPPARPTPAQAGGSPANGIPRRDTTAPLLHVPAVAPPSEVAASPLPAPAPAGAAPSGGTKGGSGRSATVFPLPGEGTRRALRGSYGCAYPDAVGLNRREREACLERGGKWAKQPDPIAAPMSAAKRGRFDQAAARQDADRAYRENPTVPSGTSEERGPGRPAGVGPGDPVFEPIRTPF
ncbi:MAG: hypothetical protein EON95_01170 [Caulobacteraceae bacterium]|nr:MAG: hypothetical protein EON95_01170 [Caulobacteraceae bacterium]